MGARASGKVQVLGIGHLAAAVRVGVRAAIEDTPESPESKQALVIACSDFPNPDSFRDANERALAARERILFVAMASPVVQIGPLVVPGRAGCFECVRPRRHYVTQSSLDAVSAPGGADVAPQADPCRYARAGAVLVARHVLASLATPYKGRLERRAGRRRCRACSGSA